MKYIIVMYNSVLIESTLYKAYILHNEKKEIRGKKKKTGMGYICEQLNS